MSLCRVPCSDRPASAAAISGRLRYDVRLSPVPAESATQPPACVDDDHPGAEVSTGLPDEPAEPRGVSALRGRGGRDHLCLRRGLRLHLGVDAAREAEHERDLEHDQHEHQHVGERRKESQPEAQRSSSGEAKRKPTPRTVWM